MSLRMSHQLRAALGIRIAIIAIKLLILCIALVLQIVILINVVNRYVRETNCTYAIAKALKNIQGVHNVSPIGVAWGFVGITGNEQYYKVEHKVRVYLLVGFSQCV